MKKLHLFLLAGLIVLSTFCSGQDLASKLEGVESELENVLETCMESYVRIYNNGSE